MFWDKSVLLVFWCSYFFQVQANLVGLPNDTNRIVGGSNALLGEYPYQGMFEAMNAEGSRFSCGCSLLTSHWAITAAHCTDGIEYGNIRLWFGLIDRRRANSFNFFYVRKIYQHPSYDPSDPQNYHDISLLRIEGEVTLNEYIAPIALPKNDSQAIVNQSCVISGWGTLEESGPSPFILQAALVPILTNEECQQFFSDLIWIIQDEQLCAGYENGGIDSCQGDSGGPLACDSFSGVPVLQGVTSFGYGCAKPGRPGVYARVSSYLNWINETMQNDSKTLLANHYLIVVLLSIAYLL